MNYDRGGKGGRHRFPGEINNISPSSGLVGTTVIIKGQNFGDSQGSLSLLIIGGTNVIATSWTDGKIVATIPNFAWHGPR
jgi:hypothetical protein